MARKVLAAALLVALAGQAGAAQATWDEELREMGYLFLHLSNINVVNGLNLTREQAAALGRLALEVEAAAPRPPTLRARLRPELEGVRKTWLELRAVLLKGENPSAELRERVTESRVAEAAFVRSTLRSKPVAANTQCISCHRAPRPASSLADSQPMTTTPALQRLVGLAHSEGLYGRRGLRKLLTVTKKVDAVLADGQQAILGSFSCCLVPPEDLSNPTRAGQAESSEKALDLLRRVRRCPEAWWPLMRAGVLGSVDQLTPAVSPGATAARRAQVRAEVARTLDRARAMSDVEFEMEKETLVQGVKDAIRPAPGEGPTKSAYFLLIPGSSRVYAAYLKRLATGERAGAGK